MVEYLLRFSVYSFNLNLTGFKIINWFFHVCSTNLVVCIWLVRIILNQFYIVLLKSPLPFLSLFSCLFHLFSFLIVTLAHCLKEIQVNTCLILLFHWKIQKKWQSIMEFSNKGLIADKKSQKVLPFMDKLKLNPNMSYLNLLL